MDAIRFREVLLHWYQQYKRDLPWRTTIDPYKIWLSEIILQQTRVQQGLPYYERLVERFPTVFAMAKATEEEVLRMWQGLGYYSRARNMHHCAQTIVQLYGGQFPATYQGLLKLKGVGPYTAAAIASISFREPVAAVDGNVYRVLARLFGLMHDISTFHGKKHMHQFATRLVDVQRPDIYSQAIMEFGALQSTSSVPACEKCVFQSSCVAYHTNSQKKLPVKSRTLQKVKRYFYNFVFQQIKSGI